MPYKLGLGVLFLVFGLGALAFAFCFLSSSNLSCFLAVDGGKRKALKDRKGTGCHRLPHGGLKPGGGVIC